MVNLKRGEFGRTMVEILGVLAIVGVLSIGGILGLRMAFEKNEANEIMHELTQRAVLVSSMKSKEMPANLNEFQNEAFTERYNVSFNDTDIDGFFTITLENVPDEVVEELKKMEWGLPYNVYVNGKHIYDHNSQPTNQRVSSLFVKSAMADAGGNTVTFVFQNQLNENVKPDYMDEDKCAETQGRWNGYRCVCPTGAIMTPDGCITTPEELKDVEAICFLDDECQGCLDICQNGKCVRDQENKCDGNFYCDGDVIKSCVTAGWFKSGGCPVTITDEKDCAKDDDTMTCAEINGMAQCVKKELSCGENGQWNPQTRTCDCDEGYAGERCSEQNITGSTNQLTDFVEEMRRVKGALSIIDEIKANKKEMDLKKDLSESKLQELDETLALREENSQEQSTIPQEQQISIDDIKAEKEQHQRQLEIIKYVEEQYEQVMPLLEDVYIIASQTVSAADNPTPENLKMIEYLKKEFDNGDYLQRMLNAIGLEIRKTDDSSENVSFKNNVTIFDRIFGIKKAHAENLRPVAPPPSIGPGVGGIAGTAASVCGYGAAYEVATYVGGGLNDLVKENTGLDCVAMANKYATNRDFCGFEWVWKEGVAKPWNRICTWGCPEKQTYVYGYGCCKEGSEDMCACKADNGVYINGRCCTKPIGPWGGVSIQECVCEARNGTWNKDDEKCCPKNSQYDPKTKKCVCYDSTDKQCDCLAQGGDWHSSLGCCPPEGTPVEGTPIWENGICCTLEKHVSNGLCCAKDEYNSNGICCPNNTYNSNQHCCPIAPTYAGAKLAWNGQKCACPSGTIEVKGDKETDTPVCCKENDERCKCLARGKYWDFEKKTCCETSYEQCSCDTKKGYEWHDEYGCCKNTGTVNKAKWNNGLCCPADHQNSKGHCCQGNLTWQTNLFGGNGRCGCPKNHILQKLDGKSFCCHVDAKCNCYESEGQLWHDEWGCCREKNPIWDNGLCCREGQHNSKGHCCPKDQEWSEYDSSFWDWTQLDSGSCCPKGTSWTGKVCCPDKRRGDKDICCGEGSEWDASSKSCVRIIYKTIPATNPTTTATISTISTNPVTTISTNPRTTTTYPRTTTYTSTPIESTTSYPWTTTTYPRTTSYTSTPVESITSYPWTTTTYPRTTTYTSTPIESTTSYPWTTTTYPRTTTYTSTPIESTTSYPWTTTTYPRTTTYTSTPVESTTSYPWTTTTYPRTTTYTSTPVESTTSYPWTTTVTTNPRTTTTYPRTTTPLWTTTVTTNPVTTTTYPRTTTYTSTPVESTTSYPRTTTMTTNPWTTTPLWTTTPVKTTTTSPITTAYVTTVDPCSGLEGPDKSKCECDGLRGEYAARIWQYSGGYNVSGTCCGAGRNPDPEERKKCVCQAKGGKVTTNWWGSYTGCVYDDGPRDYKIYPDEFPNGFGK